MYIAVVRDLETLSPLTATYAVQRLWMKSRLWMGGSLSRKSKTVMGDIYDKIETIIGCGVSQINEMHHSPWYLEGQYGRILWG